MKIFLKLILQMRVEFDFPEEKKPENLLNNEYLIYAPMKAK
jgi:hypothetical protein